ncbi:MAG: GNAT family protein [Ferruginibacter sp.]
MSTPKLSVREIQREDIPLIVDYWLTATPAHLQAMGVDLGKIPTRQQWMSMLPEQLNQPYEQKQSYCIIWLADGQPIGHSNVNKIIFGEEAYMHLHIWYAPIRELHVGTELVKMTLPYFFNNLQLKKICCEPYALNPAPNKALAKAGFQFVKEYITTPGSLNFEQRVLHWEILQSRFNNPEFL